MSLVGIQPSNKIFKINMVYLLFALLFLLHRNSALGRHVDDLPPTYISEAVRHFLMREEQRDLAPENYCSLVNSTEAVNIDLDIAPQGFLTSHEDFYVNWVHRNKTDEGVPIICKWRLVPTSAKEAYFASQVKSEIDSNISYPTLNGDVTEMVSFTFDGLDIPRETAEIPLVHSHTAVPGFQCTGSFLRFYLIDRELNRHVLAEFCGRGWIAGFDIPLLRGSIVLLHAKLLQPFRGFRLFYESSKRDDSPVLNDDKIMKRVVLQDETYSDNDLVATTYDVGNMSDRYEEACFSNTGLVLTGMSGRIRFIQPSNSSVWCKWLIKPNVVTGTQIKYIKFRIPQFKIDRSAAPCQDNVLDIEFANQENSTRVNTYCELKLPQPKRWQKADVLEEVKIVFRSTTAELAAGFEFEYYVVLASQVFHADFQQCGRSRMKAMADFHVQINPPAPGRRKNSSVTPPSLLSRHKRVVGGNMARPGSWPWIVMLSFFGYPLCAASILNDRWLLTAAHCFKDERKSVVGWEVAIGKQTSDPIGDIGWDYSSKVLRPPIELILTHYRYGRSRNPKEFDIALVKVEQPIPFGKLASPVCPPSVALSGNEICYVVGYGDTNDTQTAGFMNEAQIPIISNDNCRTMNPFYSQFVTESMICAGYADGGRDNCRGDNGGPLVCLINGRWELHGVISWGKGCAKMKAPGVYTRVSSYLHWIQKVINSYQ